MVLNHVTEGQVIDGQSRCLGALKAWLIHGHSKPNDAELIKVSATAFGTEVFLEGDLDTCNVVAVPDRCEQPIAETTS